MPLVECDTQVSFLNFLLIVFLSNYVPRFLATSLTEECRFVSTIFQLIFDLLSILAYSRVLFLHQLYLLSSTSYSIHAGFQVHRLSSDLELNDNHWVHNLRRIFNQSSTRNTKTWIISMLLKFNYAYCLSRNLRKREST